LLESAVSRGVPAFNSGDHSRCCDIYAGTMQQLKEAGIAGMQNYISTVAASTMSSASQTSNDVDRAWALRRGIDSLRSRLGSSQLMTQ